MTEGAGDTAARAGLAPEDEARAAIYGLIARLFYAPPDQDVLAQVLHSGAFEGSQAPVAVAWRELVDACRNAFPVVLENEHTALFVGTAKAEVTRVTQEGGDSHRFHVAAQFVSIAPEDRERLIRHILLLQAERIRARQGGGLSL